MVTNVNAPSGFKVAGHMSGGLPNRLSRYHIASAYASSIYRGDAVIPVNTSKNIARPGGATDRLQGVFDGCFYLDPNQPSPQYQPKWTASLTVVTGSLPDAYLYDDPNLIFEAQCSAGFVLADIGVIADLSIGTGNDYTRTSGDQIDSTTFGGSGAVFKIIDIVARPDVDFGTNAKVLVNISKHYLKGASTAI